MNTLPSHYGSLDMIVDDAVGDATYSVVAQRPTMFTPPGPNMSIINRAMVIYENEDDYG